MTEARRLADAFFPVVDDHWLAQHGEPVLEPSLAIVDPHHHLWDRPGWRYLFEDLLADVGDGHRVTATVFVDGFALDFLVLEAMGSPCPRCGCHANAGMPSVPTVL